MNIHALGEFGLIKTIMPHCPVLKGTVKGIGDDTAILSFNKNQYLLFTTDMMAQGVHFTMSMDPKLIGRKALACNVSDIASMGGLPTAAVVSLGLPKLLPVRWVKKFYEGMADVARQFKVSIVGGDTIQSERIVVNVALLGQVNKKHLVTRAGARAGDWIFVSGPLGGSLKSRRHLTFTPRIEQAQFLVKHFKPHAMIDISDGLSSDLAHILEQSQVGAYVDTTMLPRYPKVTVNQALNDGEDYELLFTLPAKRAQMLMRRQMRLPWFFYPIGIITKDKQYNLNPQGFKHFNG